MPCVRRPYASRGLTLALLGISMGCARQAAPSVSSALTPTASDDSTICQSLANRFVGLPALAERASDSPSRPAPLAGRWWIRHCSSTRHDGQLQVRLQGPGWYFVDEDGDDLSLHQQVPFSLGVELDGRVSAELVDGVFSLWIVPNKEPKVELRASQDLDVQAKSPWGSFLRFMPLVSVRAMAAERFSQTAVSALRSKLREGATATYDFRSGQGDATVGKLALGQTPRVAFEDHIPWLVNDRLLLAPASVHVVGPIAPGPTRLDVDVERGVGITYRVICAQDMDESYPALASGRVTDIPRGDVLANGSVSGLGPHITDFRVPDCRFFLVVSALRGSTSTLVSLRVRA
jgi:hypothetical protein